MTWPELLSFSFSFKCDLGPGHKRGPRLWPKEGSPLGRGCSSGRTSCPGRPFRPLGGGVSGLLLPLGPRSQSPRRPSWLRSFPRPDEPEPGAPRRHFFPVKSAFICSEQTPGSQRSRLMDANVNVHLFNWIRPQDKRDKRLPVC